MTDASALASVPQAESRETRKKIGEALFGRTGAVIGYGFSAALIYVGWLYRHQLPIDAGSGLGYALGIVGGTLMLIILLYPLRKRVRLMRWLGATSHWFRAHMILGVVGPVLILYHSNFQLGSMNSKVALYCTLLVAGSGVIGRYFYAQIHNGLYGRKANLKELTARMHRSAAQMSESDRFISDMRPKLLALDEQVTVPPDNFVESLVRPVKMAFLTRWLYYRLSWSLHKRLIARAATSPAVAQHGDRLLAVTRKFLRQHLRQVRRVAQFGFYERMFSWWHIVHVPLLYMMVLSAMVHVIAVHMY